MNVRPELVTPPQSYRRMRSRVDIRPKIFRVRFVIRVPQASHAFIKSVGWRLEELKYPEWDQIGS
jgi:hypothetical protein